MNKNLDHTQIDPPPNFAGNTDYTFEEVDYPPYGGQIDVRIHYNWKDYNRADEPFPLWGATIEDLKVLAVRNLDESGEATDVSVAEEHQKLAWELLSEQLELVTELCTEDGYRKQLGEAPYWYRPPALHPVDPPARTNLAPRMAPSVPTREREHGRRKYG